MRFARGIESRSDALVVAFGTDDNQADSHVEGPEHLFMSDRAARLDETKHCGRRPRSPIDVCSAALRQDPRKVLSDPATCDVGQSLDPSLLENRLHHV